jgi:hypothetical protein
MIIEVKPGTVKGEIVIYVNGKLNCIVDSAEKAGFKAQELIIDEIETN